MSSWSGTKARQVQIDDYMRLIDCRGIDFAIAQVVYLKKHVPRLFSINHGSSVNEIPQKILKLNVGDKARQSLLRSKSIKSGIDKTAEFNDDLPPSNIPQQSPHIRLTPIKTYPKYAHGTAG